MIQYLCSGREATTIAPVIQLQVEQGQWSRVNLRATSASVL